MSRGQGREFRHHTSFAGTLWQLPVSPFSVESKTHASLGLRRAMSHTRKPYPHRTHSLTPMPSLYSMVKPACHLWQGTPLSLVPRTFTELQRGPGNPWPTHWNIQVNTSSHDPFARARALQWGRQLFTL